MNLWDALEQAHTRKSVDGNNPMETYSLYRFLCTFLMAALRPGVIEDKIALLERGRFPMEQIGEYLRICREDGVSFDLFDEKRPFLQSPYDPAYDSEKNLKSAANLDCTRASGNNAIHFDHTMEKDVSLAPAQAARGLLAAQLFCTAGLKGPSNVNGAPPLFYLPEGKNLFETLALSLAYVPDEDDEDSEDAGEPELWRSRSPIVPKAPVERTSILYGMLFPSRRIRLTEQDGMVKKIYYQPGLRFTGFSGWSDPHVAYRFVADKKGQVSRIPLKPSQSKEPWRNISTLLADFQGTAPAVLRDCSRIAERSGAYQMRILSFGTVTNQASYLDADQGGIRLDARIAEDAVKSSLAVHAVERAEIMGSALKKALQHMISRDGKAAREAVVQRFLHRYYALCEEKFYHFCDALAAAATDEEQARLIKGWEADARELAFQVYDREAKDVFCSTGAELIRMEKARRQMIWDTMNRAGKGADGKNGRNRGAKTDE